MFDLSFDLANKNTPKFFEILCKKTCESQSKLLCKNNENYFWNIQFYSVEIVFLSVFAASHRNSASCKAKIRNLFKKHNICTSANSVK